MSTVDLIRVPRHAKFGLGVFFNCVEEGRGIVARYAKNEPAANLLQTRLQVLRNCATFLHRFTSLNQTLCRLIGEKHFPEARLCGRPLPGLRLAGATGRPTGAYLSK